MIFTFSISKLGSYWLRFHLTGTSPVHLSVRSAPDVRVSSGTSGHICTSKNIHIHTYKYIYLFILSCH